VIDAPIVSQEEPLLTPEEAWQDYQPLKIALAEEAGRPDARQWLELPPNISVLVRELVAAGVCRDERDVIVTGLAGLVEHAGHGGTGGADILWLIRNSHIVQIDPGWPPS